MHSGKVEKCTPQGVVTQSTVSVCLSVRPSVCQSVSLSVWRAPSEKWIPARWKCNPLPGVQKCQTKARFLLGSEGFACNNLKERPGRPDRQTGRQADRILDRDRRTCTTIDKYILSKLFVCVCFALLPLTRKERTK